MATGGNSMQRRQLLTLMKMHGFEDSEISELVG